MKLNLYLKIGLVFITSLLSLSCEDFVEIDAPNDKLIRDEVFGSEETAKSALNGIYNQLFLTAFSNGARNSISVLSGLSGDNLENINTTNIFRMQFQENELTPDNPDNLDIWNSAYNMIYLTNSFIEGLVNSEEIASELKKQMEGEARFIRAFTYFYLVNLYGEVPLVLTTDYRANELAARTPVDEVYAQVIADLLIAKDLLSGEYQNGERFRVNSFAASALLARVHLYLEDWNMAETLSSQVINEQSTYQILEDANEVFLANSMEAIWQISPVGGGGMVTHTNEGALFIIDPFFSFFASLELEEEFIGSFDETDNRLMSWVSFDPGKEAYFPTKYKISYSTTFPIEEYSMVVRLAEQYLIRAESRAQEGNISGAIEDVDVIRQRAGLDLISETNPGINQEQLLNLILEERRKELFTEWGHRWLDLKRTGKATQVLGSENPLWEATDILYPIPAEERMKNPNLSQNVGY
ncbi:RagB/SusD family nutrient uptake outer membrane protein [Christiangramia sp.]|uniref:RagB/SusD family nutrient uptake outer membrane protein n=1 Tax=Christiangramia sp. TaxID=1931228 RepID=UPI00262AAD5B|nr:RagB/SusD family nutrient uptake outer membrane protein [Christiangramia sp.]